MPQFNNVLLGRGVCSRFTISTGWSEGMVATASRPDGLRYSKLYFIPEFARPTIWKEKMKKQLQEIFFPSLKRAIIVLLFMGISEQLYFLRYPVLATVFNFSGSMSFVCVVAFVLISEFRRKANQKIIFFKALGEIFFQLGLMVLVFSLILGIGSNTDLQIYVIVFFFGAASLVVGKYYEKEYSDSPQNHAHKK